MNKRTKRDWDNESNLYLSLQPTLIDSPPPEKLPFKKDALRKLSESDLKVLHYVLGR